MKKLFTLSFFLSSFCLLAFAQSVKAEVYTYTATNPQIISCPLGAEFGRFGPAYSWLADTVKIVGTGFGINGDKIYLPTNEGVYWMNRDMSTTEPGYPGVISWDNNEINLQIRPELGGSLGSYFILRPANSNGSNCIRSTLTTGLICTSFSYSDYSVCSRSNTQTRTVLN